MNEPVTPGALEAHCGAWKRSTHLCWHTQIYLQPHERVNIEGEDQLWGVLGKLIQNDIKLLCPSGICQSCQHSSGPEKGLLQKMREREIKVKAVTVVLMSLFPFHNHKWGCERWEELDGPTSVEGELRENWKKLFGRNKKRDFLFSTFFNELNGVP